ncbi:MAG: C4-dicarboxylate ABC transporter permease, partial [Rhodobiaceae bacterium]
IVGFYPPVVNFLPVSTYLSSETAPPPKNPRLQACLEDHIFTVYEENRGAIEAEIATVASLDLSGLPKSASKSISGSIDKASSVFDMVEDVREAEQNVTDAAVSYREIHTEVRQIERDIRRFRKEIEDSGKRMKGTDDEDRIQRYKDRIAELEAMVAASEAGIPAEWTDTNKSFNQLNKELAGAQRIYRKSVDDAYLGIVEM